VSSAAKRKGSQAERDVVAWLKANGYQYADRRVAGATLDKGDISGVLGVTVIHKRHGKSDVDEWYCTMPAKVWLALIRKAMGGEAQH